MKVVMAGELGMCFGVRDALAAAARVERPEETTIHGELVHNPVVTEELLGRGFRMLAEDDRAALPATPRVLITAHGVSDAERARLEAAGKELIDTTCPLVRFVHSSARALAAEGRFVVVIGRPGHVEVEGIVGDLEPGRHAVVAAAEVARTYPADRIGIVCQSTTRPADAVRVRAAVEALNPQAEVRYVDTICGPTRNRQLAAEALLDRVEALVVVGGAHSNNCRQLVELARSRGLPAVLVQAADDLEPAWLERFAVVGLTAGTSTLDGAIAEVQTALEAFRPVALPATAGTGA